MKLLCVLGLFVILVVCVEGHCRGWYCPKKFCKQRRRCYINPSPDCAYRCQRRCSCKRIYRPVCGSDGITYRNICLLRKANCKSGNSVQVHSKGRCTCAQGGNIKCKNGEWCTNNRCERLPPCPPPLTDPRLCGQTLVMFCSADCGACCISGNICTPGTDLGWSLKRCGNPPVLATPDK